MNTAKPWRKSSLRSWPKRRFSSGSYKAYIPTMIFVSWLCTYLDIILVGNKLFSFPERPFPELFTINIAAVLIVLPIVTAICLYYMQRMGRWRRRGVMLLYGLSGMSAEQISERLGWFAHSGEWNHLYSFFGYMLCIWLVWKLHGWFFPSISSVYHKNGKC